jgi:tryptophan halogenase
MKVQDVVILGGGTSAWMTAAYLSYNHPRINVTVVDKEIGKSVGVGEATLLRFHTFIEECGIDFAELFVQSDATFKNGILFKNWQSNNNDIWHPFFVSPQVESEDERQYSLQDIWTNHQDFDFKRYGTGCYDLSIDNAVARNLDTAFHIDCGKLVKYLQNYCTNLGVNFIKSEMVNYNKENASINYIELKNNEKVQADLFIDCTGFNSLLNEHPDRVDLSDRLFCNTACAGHIPYQNKELEQVPYVISEAVDHGWIWSIPVKDRIGSGIVFNRNITSIEDAKEYYINYWNNRITADQLTVINWDPFYNKNMWHGNVVSIGLSAGFIEPLESTGIALIIEGIYQLSARIFDDYYRELDRDIFNATMQSFFEESIDFVNMHYYNNTRTTPFWNYVRDTHKLSNKHKIYLDFLKNSKETLTSRLKKTNFFTEANWFLWLAQMNEEITPRTFVNNGFDRSKNCLVSWKKHQDNLLTEHHKDLLARLY